MDRYFLANVGTSAPTLPAGAVKGFPQDGDLAASKSPTIPGAYAFWQLFEEMLNLVVAGGETPDPANLTQVATAVQSLASAAQANAISAAAIDATTKANNARSGAVSDANAEFTGANLTIGASGHQYWPSVGGVQRLDQWMDITVTAAANTFKTVTYPIAFQHTANEPRISVKNPTASNPASNNFVGCTVVSSSLTGCVVAIGAINAGGPDIVLSLDVRGS